jgi:hypothetical protein
MLRVHTRARGVVIAVLCAGAHQAYAAQSSMAGVDGLSPSAVMGVYRPAGSSIPQYFVAASAASSPIFLPDNDAASGFREVRKRSREVTISSDVGAVAIGVGMATAKGRRIYDASVDCARLVTSEEPGCPLSWRIRYSPLSLTGYLFSYEKVAGGEMACGPPGGSGRVYAISLRTLEPAEITEYFYEGSLLEALRGDSWARKNAEGESSAAHAGYLEHLDRIRSSAEMIAFLSGRMGVDAAELARSFAVMGYDRAADRATIRMVATVNAGFDHTRYTQLGLRVQPLPAFREVLARVTESTGFFVGKFPNGVAK